MKLQARFQVGHATDIGLRRQKNQDSYLVLEDQGLFVVADGMGGHRGGEIASSMVTEIMPGSLAAAKSNPESTAAQALTEAIQRANHDIFEKSIKDPELNGMGTTATALLFSERGRLTIGHVGDSRAYLVKPGEIWQLTRDHSYVQEKLRAGLITREQAKNDQTRNVITRSVGFGTETVVEIFEMEYHKGDVFLICSDGLSGQVEDVDILGVFDKRLFTENNMAATTSDLISWANAKGGADNTTVIIVRIQ